MTRKKSNPYRFILRRGNPFHGALAVFRPVENFVLILCDGSVHAFEYRLN